MPLPATHALLDRGYRYAVALTHDPVAAEDLVQDAWVSVHGRARSAGYFIAAIRSRFVDQQRRARIVPFEPLTDEVIGPHPRLDEALAMRDEVGAALATLSVDERESLFLNAVEGWTAGEIGELTDRSRNTVCGVLARARRKLAAARSRAADAEVETSSRSEAPGAERSEAVEASRDRAEVAIETSRVSERPGPDGREAESRPDNVEEAS